VVFLSPRVTQGIDIGYLLAVDRLFNVEAPTIDLQSHFRSSYFDLASTRLQTQQPSFVACPLGDNDTRLAFALRAPRVALATPTTAGLCFLPPKPMMPYRHYLPRFLLRRKDLSTILRNRCLALHIPHRSMLRSPALLEALQGCMSTAIGGMTRETDNWTVTNKGSSF